jgi:hypothetical protein
LLTAEDDIKEGGWNEGTEVVVDASKRRSKVEGFLDAGFEDGFCMAVEGFQCGRRLESSNFHGKCEEIPVMHHHVRSGLIELCDLGEEV